MKKLNQFFLCIVVLVSIGFAPIVARESDPYEAAVKKFESIVKEQLSKGRLAGLSAAFRVRDHQWANGYGYADIENKVPATADSSYRLASISKPFSVAGILLLVEEGKINLDEQIQKYVPYFPQKKWPVTVRQLLGHLGGISHYRDYEKECGTVKHMTMKEGIAVFGDWPLIHEPGTKFQYTSYGFNLLGAMVEEVAGEPIGEFMQKKVWKKLGMDHTGIDYLYSLVPNRVRGYRLRPDGTIENTRPVSTSLKIAGGGLRSTVKDMVAFAHGLNHNKLLTLEQKKEMWTSMVTSENKRIGYGMGWFISDFNGRFSVSHGGAQEGTRTFLLHLPAHDMTVAVASNLEGSNPAILGRRLMGFLLNEPVDVPGVYSGNWRNDLRIRTFRVLFKLGSAYFDRNRRALTNDRGKLKKAFGYLNLMGSDESVGKLKNRGNKWFSDGCHPLTEDAFLTAGSHIMSVLHEKFGDQWLDKVWRKGPLFMVSEYAKLDTRFSLAPVLGTFAGKWQRDWERTWTEEIYNIKISPEADPDNMLQRLGRLFKNRHIYPDFTQDFSRCMIDCLHKNDDAGARTWAVISRKLYPASPVAIRDLGLVYCLSGSESRGKSLIKQAAKMNPRGAAGPGGLNRVAYALKSFDLTEDGMKVLNLAIELFPKTANLYDSMGEFLLSEGKKMEAIDYYIKAIKVDPEFQNAKKMLTDILNNLKRK